VLVSSKRSGQVTKQKNLHDVIAQPHTRLMRFLLDLVISYHVRTLSGI
jgi:hypothetical protein